MAKYRNIIGPVVAVFKALADESRLRALIALHRQELCVCQIIELLALAPSTVSKHMSILKQAGLVDAEKRGRWVYYRLSGKLAPTEIKSVIEWGIKALENEDNLLSLHWDETVCCDRDNLKKILKMDPEELCRRHPEC